MYNPYTITLSLFILAGILVTGWSWRNIAKARKTLKWPNVKGVIEASSSGSIVFSYVIEEQTYKHTMEFPVDITPGQESVESPANKYPLGKEVVVYYQPEKFENATIEPGLGSDDWLIVALGIGATLLGTAFLFV